MALTEDLKKFETGDWLTKPMRRLEATLYQLAIVREHAASESKVNFLCKLEGRLEEFYAGKRQSLDLYNSLAFIAARRLIAECFNLSTK